MEQLKFLEEKNEAFLKADETTQVMTQQIDGLEREAEALRAQHEEDDFNVKRLTKELKVIKEDQIAAEDTYVKS